MTNKEANSFSKNYLTAIRNLFRSIALPIIVILLIFEPSFELSYFTKYTTLIFCFFIFIFFFFNFLKFLFLSTKQLSNLSQFKKLKEYSFLLVNFLIATFIVLTCFIRFLKEVNIKFF